MSFREPVCCIASHNGGGLCLRHINFVGFLCISCIVRSSDLFIGVARASFSLVFVAFR